MNKGDMIDAIATKADIGKREAETALNAVMDVIKDTLGQGEKVQLVGFGTFEIRTRNARKGRNPRTGEELDIKAAKIPVFKAGKLLKDAVDQ